MQSLIDAHEIPGVVTLVASRTGITHFAAQGHADTNHRVPMRQDAIFAIASMSKPITGTSVMMLQDEGKLSINDPLPSTFRNSASSAWLMAAPARSR